MNCTTPADMGVLVFWFLVAAGVATILRLMDYPALALTKANIKTIMETYFGALIAAVVGAKLLGIQLLVDGDISTDGLIVIVSLAIGGMTTLRAIIAQVQAMQNKPPA